MTDQLRPSSSSSSSPASPSTSISSAPSLCTNHCGFYGNPKQDGMCSKCFKTIALKKAAEAAAAAAVESPSPSSSSSASSPDHSLPTAVSTTPAAVSSVAITTADVVSEDIPIFRSSVSASSLPPLSFSDSMTIPLTSPEASPQLLAAPAPLPQPSTTPAAVDLASSSSSISAPSSSSSSTLSPPLSSLSLAAVSPSPAPLALVPAAATITASPATDKKRKNRCMHCNVKVGLTFFSCRCNDTAMFCSAHRYPHSHNCSFDQRKQQQALLTKANPVCAHDKLGGERI